MSSGFDEWCGAELSLHREKGRGGRGHSELENWKEQDVTRGDQYTLSDGDLTLGWEALVQFSDRACP